MRCYICNAVLQPEEVHFNRKYDDQKYGPVEPCRKCLLEIAEVFEDHLDEDELDFTLLDEDLELEDVLEEYP